MIYVIIVIAVAVILLLCWKVVRNQKIDDLPVVATCRSGLSVTLSSKVDGPVTYGGTRQCLIWLMEAFE